MKKYTDEQIKKVQELTEKGVPNVEIQKKTNINRSKITKITTDYWKAKMELKK